MNKRDNWQNFKAILDQHHIKKLYHFTDRDNLENIIQNGGLYSWKDCERKGIQIPKPGGGSLSRQLDGNLGEYCRVSFTREHPMMYVAMNDGRISNPVILEIDPEVLYDENTLYADRNAATKTAAVNIGGALEDFKKIHFQSVTARKHFDLDADEQPYYQAEILVKNHIPLQYITNIGNFGIPIPNEPQKLQLKNAYTARITRQHPTAFIFLVDQSVSMRALSTFNGEEMTLSEAVARLVNRQIEELVEKCVKKNDTHHYFDIAVVGYGEEAYSAWNGQLEGRDFVSPEEIRNNPFKTITVREEFRTRKGLEIKEFKKAQWMVARHDGRWTHLHKGFRRAGTLIDTWMQLQPDKDCFPPAIINITDGKYNGISRDEIMQMANELKSRFTNDGNVLLFNIHITTGDVEAVIFPSSTGELNGNSIGEALFELSSLLPLNYNESIRKLFGDRDENIRYRAMSVNIGLEQLMKMLKIGTLSSNLITHL